MLTIYLRVSSEHPRAAVLREYEITPFSHAAAYRHNNLVDFQDACDGTLAAKVAFWSGDVSRPLRGGAGCGGGGGWLGGSGGWSTPWTTNPRYTYKTLALLGIVFGNNYTVWHTDYKKRRQHTNLIPRNSATQ